jgi:hypothetical protein
MAGRRSGRTWRYRIYGAIDTRGPNLSGIDPVTRRLTRLFHPRRHSWRYHFYWDGARLRGRTANGRTTIRVLKINAPLRVLLRQEMINAGRLDSFSI